MKYLNCGCGQRFHPDWVNIDSVPRDEHVLVHNLKNGIPFPEHSFDVVYHSHLLEHLTKAEAVTFMHECFRVLKPGGLARIAVPDLEQIARTYLIALEQADAGSEEWKANYEWMMLELYDQTVRNRSGGEMAAYLFQEQIQNKLFILERIGQEANMLIEHRERKRQKVRNVPFSQCRPITKRIRRLFRHKTFSLNTLRERLIKRLLGEEYAALQIGRFRQNGEIHQWMYDRYSLRLLLQRCRFTGITQRTAIESDIPEWTSFHLDTDHDGIVYKPDSLYMEAVKPS